MLDLNKIVNGTMIKIENEGYVEKAMETSLKKAINDVIDDMCTWNGKLKKQLEETLKEKLELNLDELDISSYNKMITNIIKDKLDNMITVQGLDKLKNEMDELLKTCPKEIKFSEIIEKLKEETMRYEDESDFYDTYMSLHIEPHSCLTFIHLDSDDDTETYRCKYSITIDEDNGTIQSIKIDDKKLDNKLIMGGLYGLDELLFKLYTTGSKIIMDEGLSPEDYDLGYGGC